MEENETNLQIVTEFGNFRWKITFRKWDFSPNVLMVKPQDKFKKKRINWLPVRVDMIEDMQ